MIKNNEPITEDHLHAYVDGYLDKEDVPVVETWLANNPEGAQKVEAWKKQNNSLNLLFGGLSNTSDNDAQLIKQYSNLPQKTEPQTSLFKKVAVMLPLFAFGALIGGLSTSYFSKNNSQDFYIQSLPAASRASFSIYSKEQLHPVEVTADQETHLVKWLGARINKKLSAPNLKQMGYMLVGGRLLPLKGKPSAMLMYEDVNGERLTLMIGENDKNEATGFRFVKKDNVLTFYWIDNNFGYAISGNISKSKIELIATEIYKQI